jgi:hypothetical protein
VRRFPPATFFVSAPLLLIAGPIYGEALFMPSGLQRFARLSLFHLRTNPTAQVGQNGRAHSLFTPKWFEDHAQTETPVAGIGSLGIHVFNNLV